MPAAASRVLEPESSYSSVLECNRYMLDNEVACDVTFLVAPPGGRLERIKAHRYMLISRNPVFRVMFCGGLAELGGEVMLPDVQPSALKKIIRYLYCESIELAEADIFDVLYAARKYMITELEAKCFNYLSQNMTANNVCMIFNHALFYEETDLEAQCLKFLSNNTRDVIESEEYLNLTKEGMRKVVQLQTMNVPEVEIVKMCLSWAETECGRTTGEDFDPSCVHDYLGDSFYHLRLTNLHQSDLQSLVLGTGLLEQNEEESVVKFLKNSYQRSECQFVTVPRRLRESGQFVCQLASKHCTHQSMDCKKPHVHLFKVSEDISLRGFNIVDSAGIYLNGIHITIAQHNRIVFRTSMRIPAAREETQLGKVVPIHLPKHIPVKAGQFEIHLSFRAIGNRVGSCLPLQEPIDVNGIRFEAVKEDSFHICCLKFSTE